MSFAYPSPSTHVLLGGSTPFDPVWTLFLQSVWEVVGTDTATATENSPGTVFKAGYVANPSSPSISVAPNSYNTTWGAEVETLLNEIKANQSAILDSLKTAGLMNDV